MDKNYVKDMLEDIKNLAKNGDTTGIIAMCENEIVELEKLIIKQEVVNISRIIEDAKYELARLRHDDTDGLYKMLNDASKTLKNLAQRELDNLIKEAGKQYIENEYKKELSNSDQTETR